MQRGLVEKLEQAAREVFAGTDVFLAYAYGSRISGSPGPASDLDIGYYLNPKCRRAGVTVREEMTWAAKLSDRAGFSVDLRNLGEAPLELRGRVLEEGIRIYCSDEVARVNLERDLLGRYHDYKPVCEKMHRERLAAFARKGI